MLNSPHLTNHHWILILLIRPVYGKNKNQAMGKVKQKPQGKKNR